MSRTTLFVTIFILQATLSGCVTTQGPNGDSQPDLIKSISNLSIFDSTGREFNGLVEKKQFNEAYDLFNKKYSEYFEKKFINEKAPVTKELIALSDWHFDDEFRPKTIAPINYLMTIRSAEGQYIWPTAERALRLANNLSSRIADDKLFLVSGTVKKYLDPLEREYRRAAQVFNSYRNAAIESTFNAVMASGNYPNNYPIQPFKDNDYVSSVKFQNKVIETVNGAQSEGQRTEILSRLSRLTSYETRKTLTENYEIEKLKKKYAAAGYIGIDELAELRKFAVRIGSGSTLRDVIRVGFIDLTDPKLKGRNAFDFAINFNKDYGILLEELNETQFSEGGISPYDYVFVVAVSSAKISREFINKRDMRSTKQTGTRQEPNPDYITALTNYQRAMSAMQSTKMQNAIQGSQPCYGNVWVCALGGAARGVSDGIAENDAKAAAEALSRTPQYVTVPVLSEYDYQLVDVNAAKTARLSYYVIDVKKKMADSSLKCNRVMTRV